jgi:methyl-accepting chemotaxis protein
VTKSFSEKYIKKLMGKNDIEDALKRLDRLTQEEAGMASAQLLEITNAIDSEVREIADNVLVVDDRVAVVDERVAGVDERVARADERVAGVDDRVAGVDERVAGVDERVAGVDKRMAGVDERVAGVDDKVTAVMDGARYIVYQLLYNCLTHNSPRWKGGQGSYPTSS